MPQEDLMAADPRDEESIFYAALARPVGERAAYLRAACGGDPGLIAHFESLLAAHEVRDGFLETPAVGENVVLDDSFVVEGPGTVIGRYKLLEKIGEGGMAVVYMAEQEQPIRRKVALKIIKLGMDTHQVIARFEAERQALALMDHPSIAKVLDAGATDTGRPYFVMELVQGVSITEYSDRNSLSTKDRLALFIQVCNAVQHAHQKGIIHRDIKPSNVMVTHHDGKPIPKVIDFGIAKATNQRLTEKTLFTRYAHLIGTPAYMSPEQAELSDLDIDTRTDIYSLGVLLYELLTGTTPFSEEELRKAGYIEMQRVIREQEPVKPSTRIRTAWRGHPARDPKAPPDRKAAARPARHKEQGRDALATKNIDGTPMLREVRGDLDWIVMKSLEKDRARRYETPNGLAEDIRRHLAHKPVLARGPSATYRLERFLRRHRSQVVLALVIAVVAVAAGVVLSMWNRDRLKLAEAEGFKHRGILSQAREQYAKAERDSALETIKPILNSRHVGPEARLLEATILVDNRQPKEAMAVLGGLLGEKPEVAGAAHSLLARILWESGSPDAQKLEEIEEHRKQAEALLFGVPPSGGKDQSDPRKRGTPSAEAYFLRAMTALTVKEQLAALDKALQLDSGHYESRRLRAYTYYASRKYDRLRDDALVMTILRPRDPLGYSLRAVALRELGKFQEAITEYDKASSETPGDDPQRVDLTIQRSETLLRMGDYEQVIADAQECFQLWPDNSVFQYHTFCALTALGEYDTAKTLFREIIAPGHETRLQFQDWCMKHVFDVLEAGRTWHPPESGPSGAAFLPMIEAEETYHSLSAKGHRLTTDGFSANWSPDGTKLAFSLGVQGYSGVALFDPATRETELLIVPGKDPRWSPDGKHIAFVRDRQNLRLEELLTPAPGSQRPPDTDEELWVMNADGTAPRGLAQGSWPSWGRDSGSLYYLSRRDGTLSQISFADQASEPKPIMKWSYVLPSVSPDDRHVSCFEGGSLKIKDLASQEIVAECRMPSMAWGATGWSPTGNEVCLGGGNSERDSTGLWLYDLQKQEFLRVLDGQITATCWSPERTELTFCLGPPYHEIWATNVARTIPTTEALGPGRTPGEHFRKMIAFYTRRIEADPHDAYAYSGRAHYYDSIGDKNSARADMRQWSEVLSAGLPKDVSSTMRGKSRHVINLPFDCQFVFSAERPVNAISMMSVAFGQKGRCEMKVFEIPMCVASLFGVCLFSSVDAPPARAGFTFGDPVRVESVASLDSIDCFSCDGLEMYIESNRPGGQGNYDLCVLKRASINDDWGPAQNLGAAVNSPKEDFRACVSTDGLTLYFCSNRVGAAYNYDIYVTTRATKDAVWGPALSLGPAFNSFNNTDCDPWTSPDGLELYFSLYRSSGYGRSDIYVSRRATVNDPWDAPVNLGPVVNSAYTEQWLSLSPDGLLLLFADYAAPFRPGGYGSGDMWMVRRASLSDPWQAPVNLGPVVNTPAADILPRISPDGRALYFSSSLTGNWENYQAPILPIVDFNADGQVDATDMAILTENWGRSESLCDIGPFAWGDGVVDEKDLRVLTEELMTPGPKASDVPCNVILSWIGPSFADSYDVYFGTSFDDVNNATRDDPCGVLVSKEQTETTYDPNAILEFSQTYYWRVDGIEVVIGSLEPTIYRGPVLQFTTEAYAYPIQNVTATASSLSAGMGPEKTVDGSGLDENDGHSTDAKDMWQSKGGPPQWIEFEFDQVYALHELWVWNSNTDLELLMSFGAKNVTIEYSTDGTTWTPLDGVPEFAKAPGTPGYTANTIVSFGGVSAKHVKVTIEKGWGAMPVVGLSEVRFFYIPVRAYGSTP